jgi:hypothetical protein
MNQVIPSNKPLQAIGNKADTTRSRSAGGTESADR